jgi:dolichyl-phosphate-mannose-protein mannosyltransferase
MRLLTQRVSKSLSTYAACVDLWYLDPEGLANRLDDQPHKEPKSMNFFRKFVELQLLMLQHNAGLTASHPYASVPINWPFSLSGISFWTENDTQKQIYLTGNLIGWWVCVVGLSIYIGVLGADLIARRRGMDPIPDRKCRCSFVSSSQDAHSVMPAVRNRLWNNTGFFMLVWGVHYLPFFLFSRQLFIHHYLPSHLASALIAGSALSFVLSDTINYPISVRGPKTRAQPTQYADVGTKGIVITAVFSFVMFFMFSFIAPLTYGTPG